jgi:2,4'-dihydroxyacetophenone dioxygenase
MADPTPGEDLLGLRPLKELTLEERVIDPEQVPWVPRVVGFVLEGSWYYAEEDWVAKPGMMVWEPPGDVHTLMSGEEGTVTLFQLEGALLYVDEEDNVVGFDDVLNHTKTYHDFCRSEGLEPLDLDY